MSSQTPDTRTTILNAALHLLLEEGPTALKMGRIAAEAGVSRQAVYLHFGSRAGLLLAAVQRSDETMGLMQRIADLPHQDDPADAVRDQIRLTVEYGPKIQEVALAFELNRHDDPDLNSAWDDRMSARRRGLRYPMEELEKEGRLRPGWTAGRAVDLLWALGRPSFFAVVMGECGWDQSATENMMLEAFEQILLTQ